MTAPNEERWNKLQGWFEQALALPESERAAFLACVDADDELRRELAGMIRAASSDDGRIEETIAHVAAGAGSVLEEPRRFGPYRIVREIGRGGMGVVYEALREDEFQQRVALKIAPQWRGEDALHSRIRHERQVLAGLNHANIARLIDGGSEGGVPYFAMEYVEGTPITDFAAERNLSLPARIVLLQQVITAVHYAHLNMVVHRDLKPSNILVTADGIPKLLDFGIAKILDPMAGPASTATGMLWTPDYASPEQVRGLPVTAQTDVYSLGLVLYEVLTGKRAQTADLSSPLALDKSICETEPPAADALQGDIRNIIAKAIAKDPARRYNSAAEFNDDLARYMEGLPVIARASTFSYRASKFLRRHKALAAAAAALAVSIAAGFVSTLYQARRAENRFQQVRALANAFVFDVHDRIQFLPGSTPARQTIVETALRYLENLQGEAAGDAGLSRELAAAYLRIGDVQGNPTISNLGDREGALASYRKGRALLSPLVSSGDRQSMLPLASIESGLAQVSKEKGDRNAALAHYEAACKLTDAVLAVTPGDPAALAFAAKLYADWTRTLMQLNDPRANAAAERSMQIANKLAALDPSNGEAQSTLASAHNSMGAASLAASDIERAAASYREAVRIRAALLQGDPQNVSLRRDLVIGYGTLGEVLGTRTGENLGDTAGAIAALESALEHTRWMRGKDPADKRAVFDDISVRLRLGAALLESHKPDAALRVLRVALRDNQVLLQSEPANYRYRLTAAFLRRKQGEALGALGRTQDAIGELLRAVREHQTLTTGPSGAVARMGSVHTQVQLAFLQLPADPPAAGRTAAAIAADIGKSPHVITPVWNQAKVFGDLGRIYQRVGDREPARLWLDKSIALWRGLKHPKALDTQKRRELAAVEAARKALQ